MAHDDTFVSGRASTLLGAAFRPDTPFSAKDESPFLTGGLLLPQGLPKARQAIIDAGVLIAYTRKRVPEAAGEA